MLVCALGVFGESVGSVLVSACVVGGEGELVLVSACAVVGGEGELVLVSACATVGGFVQVELVVVTGGMVWVDACVGAGENGQVLGMTVGTSGCWGSVLGHAAPAGHHRSRAGREAPAGHHRC